MDSEVIFKNDLLGISQGSQGFFISIVRNLTMWLLLRGFPLRSPNDNPTGIQAGLVT
jgi:hypothetical protein